MLPETPHVLRVRHAVRGWLGRHPADVVAVALSGGADSLALTAAAVAEAQTVRALIVDHALQHGSAGVADTAARQARALGCVDAQVVTVNVGTDGGMEAAARKARYDALSSARAGAPVLLGHTLDDQAETVLLGLARGSGGRSIHGMREYDDPWGRPFLNVRRTTTRQVCADLDLTPHHDPHNDDTDFTRVRLRHEALPLLEDILGGGVAQALARTAAQLRDDGAVLDDLAHRTLAAATVGDEVVVTSLLQAPHAVRRRAVRLWLLAGGAKALTDKHIRGVDELLTDWRGQGGVAVPGGAPGVRLVASRTHGRLTMRLHGVQIGPREFE